MSTPTPEGFKEILDSLASIKDVLLELAESRSRAAGYVATAQQYAAQAAAEQERINAIAASAVNGFKDVRDALNNVLGTTG